MWSCRGSGWARAEGPTGRGWLGLQVRGLLRQQEFCWEKAFCSLKFQFSCVWGLWRRTATGEEPCFYITCLSLSSKVPAVITGVPGSRRVSCGLGEVSRSLCGPSSCVSATTPHCGMLRPGCLVHGCLTGQPCSRRVFALNRPLQSH